MNLFQHLMCRTGWAWETCRCLDYGPCSWLSPALCSRCTNSASTISIVLETSYPTWAPCICSALEMQRQLYTFWGSRSVRCQVLLETPPPLFFFLQHETCRRQMRLSHLLSCTRRLQGLRISDLLHFRSTRTCGQMRLAELKACPKSQPPLTRQVLA